MDIRDVKKNLNRIVIYKSREGNSEYEMTGCTLRCDPKTARFFYQVELQDIRNNRSILICRLEDVEEVSS